ncbi:MAG: LysR family transcriptional regulator [Alphaproteobacteria bacterium]|nr:LysR family transcriptional regulator [Alphaproteobacteria bacterium]
MAHLNYQHLYYFWTVAKSGTITRASERLALSQPTMSSQIAAFEKAIDSQLFHKDGRRLTLTDAGRQIFEYAEQIFRLGEELASSIQDRSTANRSRLSVGVVNSLPKLVVYRLLKPVFGLGQPFQMHCYEDKRERLLAELTLHGVDLVLSDAPVTSANGSRVYNHLIAQSSISVFGSPETAGRYRNDFPLSLDRAPLLLQTANIEVRRSLDEWFEDHKIRPDVIAEIEDSALLKTFASEGISLIVAPSVVRDTVERQYGLEFVGEIKDVTEQFFAITTQRKSKNAAVAAILKEHIHGVRESHGSGAVNNYSTKEADVCDLAQI